MKVYVVIGGNEWEGESAYSVRLFSTLEYAQQYRDTIVDKWDYVNVICREVDNEVTVHSPLTQTP